MRTIQLGDSMLYALTVMLAESMINMSTSRRLATVSAALGFKTRDYEYRDWRDLQTTLRGMQGETRQLILGALRQALISKRRKKRMTPDFQTWLQQVRAADAELGLTTTYTPHQPGLFLKPVTEPATAN